MAKIEVDDSTLGVLIAEELKWDYEHSKKDKKLRKALKRVLMYYMTYNDCVEYFGEEEADEYFR